MSTDNNNNGSESKQPLRLSKPGKLELRKTVDAGQVKQSFSHGRSKTVVVEKRTKRTFERGATGKMAAVPNQELAEGLASRKKSGPSSDQDRADAARRAAERAFRDDPAEGLTASEREKRIAVLEQAKAREEERAEQVAADAARRGGAPPARVEVHPLRQGARCFADPRQAPCVQLAAAHMLALSRGRGLVPSAWSSFSEVVEWMGRFRATRRVC